jgi:hypothetical protein
MVHYIPTKSTATAVDIANLFITYVWKLHGLPKKTVLDRGSVFNSKFMKQLYKQLDIAWSFSTAYHPQTNGQSKHANQVFEMYLRQFVNHHQEDWDSLLPMAEFAYNNGVQASTGKRLFQICYGFSPRLNVGKDTDGNVPNADEHAEFLKQGHGEVRASLELANEHIKHFYNQNHRAPEDIQVGDKVWLSHQNIETDRLLHKLSHKGLGPYTVLEKIGSHAFRLQIPHTMKIHPVFHVTLLKKHHADPHGREPPQPPPTITEKGKEEYDVEEVLNSRYCGRWKKLEYFVKWLDYGPESNSWEPAENLDTAVEKVTEFHRRFPQVPRP